jgi:hypothetical protein
MNFDPSSRTSNNVLNNLSNQVINTPNNSPENTPVKALKRMKISETRALTVSVSPRTQRNLMLEKVIEEKDKEITNLCQNTQPREYQNVPLPQQQLLDFKGQQPAHAALIHPAPVKATRPEVEMNCVRRMLDFNKRDPEVENMFAYNLAHTQKTRAASTGLCLGNPFSLKSQSASSSISAENLSSEPQKRGSKRKADVLNDNYSPHAALLARRVFGGQPATTAHTGLESSSQRTQSAGVVQPSSQPTEGAAEMEIEKEKVKNPFLALRF